MFKVTEEEEVPIIKNWLGREGLRFIQTFTNNWKETCKTVKELFSPFSEKFKLHCIDTTSSLQYCTLQSHGSVQEWMGRLHVKVMDCEYKEYDRRLKEQFINCLDDENQVEEIITYLTAYKDTNDVSSKQILLWAQKVEVQNGLKELLDNIKDTKGSGRAMEIRSE